MSEKEKYSCLFSLLLGESTKFLFWRAVTIPHVLKSGRSDYRRRNCYRDNQSVAGGRTHNYVPTHISIHVYVYVYRCV